MLKRIEGTTLMFVIFVLFYKHKLFEESENEMEDEKELHYIWGQLRVGCFILLNMKKKKLGGKQKKTRTHTQVLALGDRTIGMALADF